MRTYTRLSFFGTRLRCFLFFLFVSLVARRTRYYWPHVHPHYSAAKSELTREHIFHMFLTKHRSPGECDSSCAKNKIPLLWRSFLFFLCVDGLSPVLTDLIVVPSSLRHILTLGLPKDRPMLCHRNKHSETSLDIFFWDTESSKTYMLALTLFLMTD